MSDIDENTLSHDERLDVNALSPNRFITGVPDGMQPTELARLIESECTAFPNRKVSTCFVARDGRRMQKMADLLKKLMPSHDILAFRHGIACHMTEFRPMRVSWLSA